MTDILDRSVECQKGPCDRVQQMTESENAEMESLLYHTVSLLVAGCDRVEWLKTGKY